MSDTCQHGNSRGMCGNPACIAFNAGIENEPLSEASLKKFCEALVKSGIVVKKRRNMSDTHWSRVSAKLVEISVTSTEAPADNQKWELRFENGTLELKLMDDLGILQSRLVIHRKGTDVIDIEVPHEANFSMRELASDES